MEKRNILMLVAVLILCLQITAVGASDIIVIGADTIQNVTATCPSAIPDATPRIIVEYVDSISQSGLYAMPEDLINVTREAMPRTIVEYTNSISHLEMHEMPEELLNTTKEVPERRLIIEYAESNSYIPLKFPIELMNDATPPIIDNISVTNVTNNSAVIAWRTDEFADSLVKYGANPMAYTRICKDNLFVKEHLVTLTGLSPAITYYFVVNSTDRSENSAQSVEYNFTTLGGIKGDLDGDCEITSVDAVIALQLAASGEYNPAADISGDGRVASLDALMILQAAADAISL
ncbi:MAG: fibronectin type III domain-containing protein [Candidatus Methanospirareceae archaeon]